jgi:hypothetical protein
LELDRPTYLLSSECISSKFSTISRLFLIAVLHSSLLLTVIRSTLSNMHSFVTFLSLSATLVALASSQQCYGLDGAQLDDTFAPCNPKAKQSGCCATKRSSGADVCLDSGLCMSTSGEVTGMLWQVGCTDPTGKDIGCPSMCPSSMFTSSYLPNHMS